jgi:undecaprenyl-diphosphatase
MEKAERLDDKPLSLRLRWYAAEVDLCRRAMRARTRPLGLAFFRAVSWLGDGPLWFALALILPLAEGRDGLHVVARMAISGIAATLASRGLKVWIGRPRPFLSHSGISAAVAPLDRWSFPSGHTLHAVTFTALLVAHLPLLALALVPFTLAVAASRVVLGLHYPSDSLAGALVGGLLAAATLVLS